MEVTLKASVKQQVSVIIEELSKSFASDNCEVGTPNVVLNDLTLTLNVGELCTVFGPNGSGKTTLLNLIAGLMEPDSGTITIEGRKPVPGLATYIFQNFKDSLFPWRTVEGNLLFPLECQIPEKGERHKQLQEFMQEFEFPVPLQARVYELSVGQQQMVSLARALITQPRFLLMDEPFSALDFRMRRAMQEQLLRYWQMSGATILLVSHEIDEAIYLGQRLFLFPPRPITTVRDIPIPLPLPRCRDVLYTNEFFQIRSEVLSFFDENTQHTT